jgi:hypothetical protein
MLRCLWFLSIRVAHLSHDNELLGFCEVFYNIQPSYHAFRERSGALTACSRPIRRRYNVEVKVE